MAPRAHMYAISEALLGLQEIDMGRIRLQQKGDLQACGGWWKLRWRVDRIGEDGKPKRGWSKPVTIGPAKGNDAKLPALTEPQARRIAWDQFLSKVDKNITSPLCVTTFGEFIERHWIPEYLNALPKRKSREAGKSNLKHVLPLLENMRLSEVRRSDCQAIVNSLLAKRSTQTVRHVGSLMTSVFRLAMDRELIQSNPAAELRYPAMCRAIPRVVTAEQSAALIARLDSPAKEMLTFASCTGMNIAEVCGLCWKHINLSARPILCEDHVAREGKQIVTLRPMTFAVLRQWDREYKSTKRPKRDRVQPLTAPLVEALESLMKRAAWTSPDDPVFTLRDGKPVDQKSILKNYIKPVAAELGMGEVDKKGRKTRAKSWVNWRCIRRAFSTVTDQQLMPQGARIALMGHESAATTELYNQTTSEDARKQLERVAAAMTGKKTLEDMPSEGTGCVN